MADLGRTLQGRNLHHRGAIVVMDGDLFLMLLDKCRRSRWRDVIKGAIGDCPTHFCRDVIGRERVQALGGGVRDDTGLWRTASVFDNAPSNCTATRTEL